MTNLQIQTSFPELRLPDGRAADKLDRFELAGALMAIGVAGVDQQTPKQQSLQILNGLREAAEKARRAQGDAA